METSKARGVRLAIGPAAPGEYHPIVGQGLTAYQTAGVVLDLDPGTSVSRFHTEYPDLPRETFTFEVTLVVTD